MSQFAPPAVDGYYASASAPQMTAYNQQPPPQPPPPYGGHPPPHPPPPNYDPQYNMYMQQQQQQQQHMMMQQQPYPYPPPQHQHQHPQQQQFHPHPHPHPQQQHYGQVTPLDRTFGVNKKCLVKQKVEMFEMITGFETSNKYTVTMENGLKLVAMEESNFLGRWCLGANRPFTMHVVFKDTKQEILHIERPFTFFFSKVNVYDVSNNGQRRLLGSVKQRFSIFTREFSVVDPSGKEVYHIQGPCCTIWSFYIHEPGNPERLGEIKKKWSGFLKEMYTDSDNFGIQFPDKATSDQRALLFGATFLIDFLFFEEKHRNNND